MYALWNKGSNFLFFFLLLTISAEHS